MTTSVSTYKNFIGSKLGNVLYLRQLFSSTNEFMVMLHSIYGHLFLSPTIREIYNFIIQCSQSGQVQQNLDPEL